MTHADNEAAPSLGSRQIVELAYAFPNWATGFISAADARFLADCLASFEPRIIIEVGVASGVSTAFLLKAMDLLGLDAKLFSFDIMSKYYADPRRAVGAFLTEAFDSAPARLSLFPGVRSVEIPRQLRAADVAPADLIFIDADHVHPWPCIDLLGLLPATRAGAWIILHDIDLPNLHPELGASGPAYLFERWPGVKRAPAADVAPANIGAIRLFETDEENVNAILSILELPWDEPINDRYFRPVTRFLDQMGGGQANRLQAIYRRNVPPSTPASRLVNRAAASLKRRLASAAARYRRHP